MNTIKLTAVIEFTGENLTKEWAEKEFNSMQEVYLDNLKLYPEINSKLEELYGHIENVELCEQKKTYVVEFTRELYATIEVQAYNRVDARKIAEEKIGNLGQDDWKDYGEVKITSIS